MSKEEENALKNLRKDETITILPADKGKSVVVMDSKEYKEKVSTLLVPRVKENARRRKE